MYQYCEYNKVTKDSILRRVAQEDIYYIALGYHPKAYQYIASPFRQDKSAGAYFLWYDGVLYFKDFGDPHRKMRDCFQFLMDAFQMNYPQTLDYLDAYFELGIRVGTPKPEVFQSVIHNVDKSVIGRPHRLGTKQSVEITFKHRDFINPDKIFWYNRYQITRENLIMDNVFPTIWYKFLSKKTGELVVIRPADLCYTYGGFNLDHVKIYRPFGDDKSKWLTNCTNNDIGGLHLLSPSKSYIIIAKSYKDWRVLTNQGLNCIYFQNEGQIPDDNIMLWLMYTYNVRQVIVWFDNDSTGIQASMKVVNWINQLMNSLIATSVCLPEQLLLESVKDPSDMMHKKGHQVLNSFIYHNVGNIINPSNMDGASERPF